MAAFAVMKQIDNFGFNSETDMLSLHGIFVFFDNERLAVEEFPVEATVALGANTAQIRQALAGAARTFGTTKGYLIGATNVLLPDYIRA